MHVIFANYNKLLPILAKCFKMFAIIIKQLVYIGIYEYKQAKSKHRGLVGGGRPPGQTGFCVCFQLVDIGNHKLPLILAKHTKMLAICIKHYQKPIKQTPCSPMVGHRALDQGVVGSIPGAVGVPKCT